MAIQRGNQEGNLGKRVEMRPEIRGERGGSGQCARGKVTRTYQVKENEPEKVKARNKKRNCLTKTWWERSNRKRVTRGSRGKNTKERVHRYVKKKLSSRKRGVARRAGGF